MGFTAAFRALVAAYLAREKGRTLLTVLGVALGVAVLVAIDLANESAVASFRRTMDEVAGRAQITVRGNGSGLRPEVLSVIASTPGVASASPLITGEARFTPAKGPAVTMLVVGSDFLFTTEDAGASVRDMQFEAAPGMSYAEFIARPDAPVVTAAFARRHGLEPGDEFDVAVGGSLRRVRAAGVLSGGDLRDAYDGNMLLVDLGVADEWLRRGGMLDRVDVVVGGGVSPARVEELLRSRLPGDALVERPESRSRRVQGMLEAFRFNLAALGHVSVLVGAFLIYNAIGIAVVRRRGAIGTLRALGLGSPVVARVFVAEGALLGLVGGIAGVALGVLLARLILAPMSDAISINFVEMRPESLDYPPLVLVGAVCFGVAAGVLASVPPAREAASTPPSNTMRRGGGPARALGDGARVALGAICALASAALSTRAGRQGIPFEGYLSGAFAVAAFVAWSRPLLALLLRLPGSLVHKALGTEGLLAFSGLRGSISRAVPAVAGLLVSLAMCIAVVVMVSSFRSTVLGWMDQVLQADLFVGSATTEFTDAPSPLPLEFAERASRLPGVESADYFRARRIVLGDREAWLAAGRFDRARFRDLDASGRDPVEILSRARTNREVIVSEAFARKHGVGEGATVTIPTSLGPREHRIAAIYFDYSTEQGFIVMDRSLYDEYFKDSLVDSVSLWLAKGADPAEVRAGLNRLAAEIPGTPGLAIRGNRELREYAIGAFDRTFRVTQAIQAIALLVAVLGVSTTLLAQIIDRRHETITLRCLGATRRRIARIVVVEAGLLGTTGVVLGTGAGIVLSWILTKVIMLQSFGWTIRFRLDLPAMAQVAVIVFAGTLAAGLMASREAVRTSPDRTRTLVG